MRRTRDNRRVRFFPALVLACLPFALLPAGCPRADSGSDSATSAIDLVGAREDRPGTATGNSATNTEAGDTRTTTSEGGHSGSDVLNGSGSGAFGNGINDAGGNGTGTSSGGESPGLSDDAVFAALSAAVATDPGDEFDAPADAAPHFGEDPALYSAASDAQIDVSTESIARDVGRSGARLDPAATGGVRGRWIPERDNDDPDRVGGIIRGAWFNHENVVVGVLRGVYIPLDPAHLPKGLAGGGLIRARIIDVDGQFRGLLRGRYGRTAAGRHLLAGRWFDRYQRLVGVVRGSWRNVDDMPGGVFAGRWAAFSVCLEAESMPEVRFNTDDFGGLPTTGESTLPSNEETDPDEVSFDQDSAVGALAGDDCVSVDGPSGFLRGWHLPRPIDDDGDGQPDRLGGVFRAHWRAAGGGIEGVVLGRYVARDDDRAASGEEPPGPRVRGRFYGRILNTDGELIGYVRGYYGRGRFGVGVFLGQYFDAEKQPEGVLRGRWDDAPDRPGGPLLGVWRDAEALP